MTSIFLNLTLLPCLRAQCAHLQHCGCHNPLVWEFALSCGDWSDRSDHVAFTAVGVSPVHYLGVTHSFCSAAFFLCLTCQFIRLPSPLNTDLIVV